MRVVVTRPAQSAERTAARLRQMGHDAILLPLTRALHKPDAAVAALSGSTGPIAVTSAEAIRALEEQPLALAPHLHRPLFAVGKATARQATAAGFTTVRHAQASGLELAELISNHRPLLSTKPLLYLAGLPRAAGFETRLGELGIPFETVECYAMQDEDPSEAVLDRIFLDAHADCVLLYSRHTAERLFSLPFIRRHAALLAATRIHCLSATVAEAVPDHLRANVEIAATPDENSLLAPLE